MLMESGMLLIVKMEKRSCSSEAESLVLHSAAKLKFGNLNLMGFIITN